MKIEQHIPLAPLTTFRIGGKADYFCVAHSVEDLVKASSFARDKGTEIFVLGNGSNVLFKDNGFRGLVIKVDIRGIEISQFKRNAEVGVGAGEDWDEVVEKCIEKELYGLENLSGIPGTVGAAPVQNIGAYGSEISKFITSIDVFDIKKRRLEVYSREDCEFGYRDSVFKRNNNLIIAKVNFLLSKTPKVNLSYRDVKEFLDESEVSNPAPKDIRTAVLEIRSRKFPDLEQTGTAGSFFKNPVLTRAHFNTLKKKYPELHGYPDGKGGIKVPLAWILEHVCKFNNLRKGDVGVAPHQTLVICNLGNATSKDVNEVAEEIFSCVKEKTGIEIEREVKCL